MKSAIDKISSLWSKPEPVKKVAPPARVKRLEPSPADLALAKYSGDPAIVAAHAIWGAGRLWPADTAFEQRASGYFNLASDKIVGVLAAGTGAAAIGIANHLPTFVYGYDWRALAEVPGTQFVKESGHGAKVLLRTINLDTVIPAPRKCEGLIAIEPVLTRSQERMLDWLRLSVSGGGQIVLEEPSVDNSSGFDPMANWFADMDNKDCDWQGPGSRKNALEQAGFSVGRVQETTGGAVRVIREALDGVAAADAEICKAIELAPILEPVREFFEKEVNAARNRLRALESGGVAVYRYRAIKQRVGG
ncbi:hypothetical protein MNBD_ALPHA06-1621 [hydrothermal vent metagenome]|uniref:Methyltransferase type 11 domain-containing protein n=1 Tax=hydrothermal vent metagenome TaxID=652676 RepID=A0A3B0S4S5_9ZZZZ